MEFSLVSAFLASDKCLWKREKERTSFLLSRASKTSCLSWASHLQVPALATRCINLSSYVVLSVCSVSQSSRSSCVSRWVATSLWPFPHCLTRKNLYSTKIVAEHHKNWKSVSKLHTKLLKSWYVIVGYECILCSCADMMRWGCTKFPFKNLQTALCKDPKKFKPWTDLLAAPINEIFEWIDCSSLDSDLLPSVDCNSLLHSGQSKGLPEDFLSCILGTYRPLNATLMVNVMWILSTLSVSFLEFWAALERKSLFSALPHLPGIASLVLFGGLSWDLSPWTDRSNATDFISTIGVLSVGARTTVLNGTVTGTFLDRIFITSNLLRICSHPWIACNFFLHKIVFLVAPSNEHHEAICEIAASFKWVDWNCLKHW